jgi:hypothetical protein
MREFVAVTSPVLLQNAGTLKQQALMFDRIAIPTLSEILKALTAEWQELRSELEWLIESGIVFEPNVNSKVKVSTSEYELVLDLLREDGKRIIEYC